MRYQIPYNRTLLEFEIPDSFAVEELKPAPVAPVADSLAAVGAALDQPVGEFRLGDYAKARRVAIAINDKTRPVPQSVLLPPLLERLARVGIPDDAITLMIATGTHQPMTRDEITRMVPATIFEKYRVICHDSTDDLNLVYMGETTRGTPISINRLLAEADLRIVVGNLEPHQFMGYSGGVKTAVIGLGGRITIDRNHAMLLDPRSSIARYADNPMRQDIEEIGDRVGIHLALNALLNENKQMVGVLAGSPRAVMQEGIPRLLELYRVRVAEPFDLTITSPGGYPKDINLYQAQKALAHATFVTRAGGAVILIAACSEGTGSNGYEEWIKGKTSHQEVLARFKQEGFRIGPHKAFQLARDAVRERILLVTEMDAEFVRGLLLERADTLDAALGLALANLHPGARVGIIPYANATIPELMEEVGRATS